MATVHDVAAFILQEQGQMSAMKLQKLVYYSQAWHLVWDDEPLFRERIRAWANGPVVYELFDKHRGRYAVSDWRWGDATKLTRNERETVEVVLDNYGHLDGRKLSHLTHSEDPWRDAREGLEPTAPSNAEITKDALVDYYGAVDAADESTPVDEIDWSGWEQEPAIRD